MVRRVLIDFSMESGALKRTAQKVLGNSKKIIIRRMFCCFSGTSGAPKLKGFQNTRLQATLRRNSE